jgi:hypothetical protein
MGGENSTGPVKPGKMDTFPSGGISGIQPDPSFVVDVAIKRVYGSVKLIMVHIIPPAHASAVDIIKNYAVSTAQHVREDLTSAPGGNDRITT